MSKSKQPDTWTRFAIERESGGNTFGRFRAALATNGEASDGDILSIPGMRVADSMPMLFRHDSTIEVPSLGRIIEPSKDLKGAKETLRVTGLFDLEGESDDPLLAIRKGFASLVHSHTLDAMSVRWDPVFGKFMRRVNLPSDHPAFVDSSKAEGAQQWGIFFEESVAREGSIVAIGADPEALMGRARESVSAFEEAYWTVLAGRLGRGEGAEAVPDEQRTMFEAMTKVIVEAVRAESREAFKLVREHEADLGESPSDEAKAKAPAKETSREVPVETRETETKKVGPRTLDGAGLRDLIRETATESVDRKLDHALGRITR